MPDLVSETHSRGTEFIGKFQNIGNGVEDGFLIPCIDENLRILLEAKLNSKNSLREKKGLETFDFGPMVDTDNTTVLGIGVFGDKEILAELAGEIYKGRLQKLLDEQIRLNDKAREEGLTAVEVRDKERALGQSPTKSSRSVRKNRSFNDDLDDTVREKGKIDDRTFDKPKSDQDKYRDLDDEQKKDRNRQKDLDLDLDLDF